MALDLHEQDDFRFWVLAQQDPKKFSWASPDRAGTVTDASQQVMAYAKELGALPVKGDIWTYAKAVGMVPVYKVKVFDEDTGKFLRYDYVDESGKFVDTTGRNIIESKHRGAKDAATKFFGIEED